MSIRIRIGFFVCALAIILLTSFPAHAADKLRIATGGFSPSVPPFVSFAKAQMLKQDIEVEDILMSGGSLSAQTLAAGQVKIIVTTSAVVPQFNLSGGDMVIVAGTINKLPYQIVARGEFKTPALLKGKRVAISRLRLIVGMARAPSLYENGFGPRPRCDHRADRRTERALGGAAK